MSMTFKYKAQNMTTGVIQELETTIFPNEDDDAEFDFLNLLDHWNKRSQQFKYWSNPDA